MESLESLKSELRHIQNIYLNAKLFFQDTEYLYNPDTEQEKDIADKSYFIRRTRISSWRSTILELCKLYQSSKNEHFNLFSFLKKLLSSYNCTEWKQKIPKENLENLIEKINFSEIKLVIENLKVLRDKEIAHTDRIIDNKNIDIVVTFEEIKKLLELTEEVIQQIQNYYFNTNQIFRIPESEKAGGILTILVKEKKERIEKLNEEYKKHME